MQGHAAANLMPVVAANRIGEEPGAEGNITFYGSSFIADHTGLIVAELTEGEEGVAVHSFDLDLVARQVGCHAQRVTRGSAREVDAIGHALAIPQSPFQMHINRKQAILAQRRGGLPAG